MPHTPTGQRPGSVHAPSVTTFDPFGPPARCYDDRVRHPMSFTRPHVGSSTIPDLPVDGEWTSTRFSVAPVSNGILHGRYRLDSTTAASATADAAVDSVHGRLSHQGPWSDSDTEDFHSGGAAWLPPPLPLSRDFACRVLPQVAYDGAFYLVQNELKRLSGHDINLIPLKIFTYGFQPVVLALVITGTAVALCVFAPAAMTTIGLGLLSLVKVSASAEIAKIVGAYLLATAATHVVKPVIDKACKFSYTKIVSSYFNRLLDQSTTSAMAAPARLDQDSNANDAPYQSSRCGQQ